MQGESLQTTWHLAQGRCSSYIRASPSLSPAASSHNAEGGGHPGLLVPKFRRYMGTERIWGKGGHVPNKSCPRALAVTSSQLTA